MKAKENKNEKELLKKTGPTNEDWEGNDKAPGEEEGIAEKVTQNDLKGKKVDADPAEEKDKPLSQ